jgi:hypothetical protein
MRVKGPLMELRLGRTNTGNQDGMSCDSGLNISPRQHASTRTFLWWPSRRAACAKCTIMFDWVLQAQV